MLGGVATFRPRLPKMCEGSQTSDPSTPSPTLQVGIVEFANSSLNSSNFRSAANTLPHVHAWYLNIPPNREADKRCAIDPKSVSQQCFWPNHSFPESVRSTNGTVTSIKRRSPSLEECAARHVGRPNNHVIFSLSITNVSGPDAAEGPWKVSEQGLLNALP